MPIEAVNKLDTRVLADNSSSPSPTALHRIDHYVSVNDINDPKLDISMVVNKVIWDIKTQTLYYINRNGMCMKLGPK